MTNNLTVTQGTGTTMATDDVSGVHYPYVKLASATEDATTAIGTGAGTEAAALRVTLPTDGTGVVGLAAGTAHVGEVGGNTTVVKITPTITTTLYTALDLIGGIITITSAMRVSGGSGILQSMTVIDDDNEKAAFEVMIFDSSPASGTYTDNGAYVHSSGDVDKFLGRFSVAAADYVTEVSGSLAVATVRNIGLPVKASGSANLYALVLVTGGPTYTAVNDLRWHFGFLRD
jgi:hypothetical protein